MWTPVVDISEHQGNINFATMKMRGVSRVLMRITHGQKMDANVLTYYQNALAAGFHRDHIGFYSFINPKRGSGKVTAQATASAIRTVTGGRTAVLYMLDVESYMNETPLVGTSPVRGTEFAAYLREHIGTIREELPGVYVFMYSNQAYWNSSLGPQDSQLAGQYEWLVPRYPIYSTLGYDRLGYPPAPPQWNVYAFKLAGGPYPPAGAEDWQGWQFSAGYNKQGPVYGCQSADLDLNIVDTVFADKWFADHETHMPPPPPPIVVPPIQTRSPEVLIPHRPSRIHSGIIRADIPTAIAVAPGTPPEATGIALNITFNGSLKPGYATIWDGTEIMPEASMINWSASATPSNGFTITQILDGSFYVNAIEEVNLIFDQVGYTMTPIPGPKGDKGEPGTGATDQQIVDAVVKELTD